jgi:hypothetical protein
MYQCPHCRQPGISFLRKWWSCSTAPARCTYCKSLSYVPDTVANAILFAGVLTFVLTVAAGMTTRSWLLGFLFLAVSIMLYCLFWHAAGLRRTTLEQVASARNLNWAVLFITVVANLMS